jgi:hypothetical protein
LDPWEEPSPGGGSGVDDRLFVVNSLPKSYLKILFTYIYNGRSYLNG